MEDDTSKAPPGGLSELIQLLHLSGASHEVTNNFVRLYLNASSSSSPLPPIVELKGVIEVAVKETANIVIYEALRAHGIDVATPPGQKERAAAAALTVAATPGKSTSHIYRLQIGSTKTSVSLPEALYSKSKDTLGPEMTDKLIHELAASPPPDVRRSAHVQQGLRKAIERAQRVPRRPPPTPVQ